MATPSTRRPRVAVTMGDLSGIGPEIVVKLLAEPASLQKADVYLVATEGEVERAASEFGVTVPVSDAPGAGAVYAVGSDLVGVAVTRGEVTKAAGERAMADLRTALALQAGGEVDAVLYAPLNKASMTLAGMVEEDDLRWFAREIGFDGPTSEVNLVPGLTTSRVTSHVPVREIARGVSAKGVLAAIRLLDGIVRSTGVARPRLAVCALNPHAGEGGKFGDEESEHIAPGIELARHEGVDAHGPYPCDTVFIRARAGDFDGVVTMYHDQGQIAMKLLGFDEGVTVQGGLPVPIATPAHGTAHEIVGRGVASTGPVQRAYDVAVSLAGGGLPAP